MRFVIVTSCWVIALSLLVQVVVWSLCTFTELRFASPEVTGEAPLVVQKAKNKTSSARGHDANQRQGRWRPKSTETVEEDLPVSAVDRVFKIIVTVARTMALMSALIVCPVLCLGVLLAVPAGAPRVERAVNALIWAIVLVPLIMPLGGWFGMAWRQGTITDYTALTAVVDAGRERDRVHPRGLPVRLRRDCGASQA